MEYIYINNYDSELHKKKRNIKAMIYNIINIIFFNINSNGEIYFKKRAIKKLSVFFFLNSSLNKNSTISIKIKIG